MMKLNLQYFGGRGSAAGKRTNSNQSASKTSTKQPKSKISKSFKLAQQGKFDNGKTPSQISVGKEMRLPSGSTAYKAASNKWAVNTNGASFTTDQKIRISANMNSMAVYSNNDIKRLLKS